MEIGQLVEWGTPEKLRKGIFIQYIEDQKKADVKCISYCGRPFIINVTVESNILRKTR